MPAVLAIIDFLDSRERAVALWAAAILLFAIVKGEGVITSLVGVLRALVQSKILLLFGTAALYCAGIVALGHRAGLWHTSATKETVYWFVGSALVLVGNATHASPNDATFARRLLRKAVRFTLIVEFLVTLYVLPFGVELFLVPLIGLFVGMQVVAAYDPSAASAKGFIDAVLLAIGFGLMLYVTVSALTDIHGLLTRENGEKFLLAPAMTLALLPFLYVVAWLSRREQDNLRKRYPLSRQPG
jgi:hypothetical protein